MPEAHATLSVLIRGSGNDFTPKEANSSDCDFTDIQRKFFIFEMELPRCWFCYLIFLSVRVKNSNLYYLL